ncbi:ABC transporter, putative, partial [Eimeria maxima]
VLGLVGTNGTGKSTALKILGAKLKPNLGRYSNPPEWREIVSHFRGSELQNYFTKIIEESLKVVIKPQYVDLIPKQVKGEVGEVLRSRDTRGVCEGLIDCLDLRHLLKRQINELSGGELQRFCIGAACTVDAQVLMFDEPSSYLDVKQRIQAANTIRGALSTDNYIIVVEHDLSVVDYLSDFVCCLWGVPGAYGVVTTPFSVREGINHFLDGFIPTENLRIRDESLNFKLAVDQDLLEDIQRLHFYEYPEMTKTLGTFELKVEKGNFSDSEIIVMLGQNGTGKSTFIRMLAGLLTPDNTQALSSFAVSYKPQTISAKFQGTVKELFYAKIRDAFNHPQFQTDVVRPLDLDKVMDQQVQLLSGGELQRVALIVALGKPADIYLIDEPSAYLDSEQRIAASKVIKRYILHAKKTAFLVEHDFIMATYLADRVIVFGGEPG